MDVLLIKADGTEREVEGYLTLEGVQFVVGGSALLHVTLLDGRHMFLDENGLRKGKPTNGKATALYHRVVLGDVLVLTDDEYTRMSNVRSFKRK